MQLYKGQCFEIVFLDWCQEFPGQCIISCEKPGLSDLSDDDWIELGKMEKELERITKKLFGATMYNFACLMNNAYRDDETPHVHFQFIPRYKGKREILGKNYKDHHFGYNLWKWSRNRFKAQKDIFSKDEKEKMFTMMKDEFKM